MVLEPENLPPAGAPREEEVGMSDKNLDTSNKYAVSSNRRGIVIRNPPRAEMTKDEAIMLAALLVVAAGDFTGERFKAAFEAVTKAFPAN
jgi:hypothetical protein